MWFLNPGRDALYAVLKRLLEPYVENLDLNKFQAGLWAGQFSVNNLTLKKSALDKFRLPIDVIEGMLLAAHFDSLIGIGDAVLMINRTPRAFDS